MISLKNVNFHLESSLFQDFSGLIVLSWPWNSPKLRSTRVFPTNSVVSLPWILQSAGFGTCGSIWARPGRLGCGLTWKVGSKNDQHESTWCLFHGLRSKRITKSGMFGTIPAWSIFPKDFLDAFCLIFWNFHCNSSRHCMCLKNEKIPSTGIRKLRHTTTNTINFQIVPPNV